MSNDISSGSDGSERAWEPIASNDDVSRARQTSERVERGVRKEDVDQLVNQILADKSMNMSMVPDAVERVVYQSTIKLTFNIFYKGLASLDGFGIVTAAHTSSKSACRELHLERHFFGLLDSNDTASSWRSFQSNIDPKPLQDLAETLLKNKAINQKLLPDGVERQLYMNCLKIIFWILDLVASSVKVNFCGHTLSMDVSPLGTKRGGLLANAANAVRPKRQQQDDCDDLVNPQTIQDFSANVASLLEMDGTSPWDDPTNASNNRQRGMVQDGFKWMMKSSWSKMHSDMIQSLSKSLYGLVLAIVNDLLNSTSIDILSDRISLRVSTKKTSPNNHNSNKSKSKTSSSTTSSSSSSSSSLLPSPWQIHNGLACMGFDQERELWKQRMQEMTPKQRAILLADLQHQ